MTDYWTLHHTVVITWPGDMPGVAAIGPTRRNPDGTVSVQYTRDALVLALQAMRGIQALAARQSGQPPVVAPTPPTVTRPVFTRLSTRDGKRLAAQAAARQEALL